MSARCITICTPFSDVAAGIVLLDEVEDSFAGVERYSHVHQSVGVVDRLAVHCRLLVTHQLIARDVTEMRPLLKLF